MSPNQSEQLTIGIDLGDRVSHYCVIDAQGVVVEEGRMRTLQESVRQWALRFAGARMVIEAGTHSAWMSRLLEELGHEVIVGETRARLHRYGEQTRMIGGTPNAWPVMVGLILHCSPPSRTAARIFS